MELLTCEEDNRHELIQRIRHALYCAHHDLLDGVLVKLSTSLGRARERYPEAMQKVMREKYFAIVEDTIRVEEKVASSRSHPESRHTIYEEISSDVPVLLAHLNLFKKMYLPEIVKSSKRMEKRERTARHHMMIGWAIAIIGITIAIIIRLG